MAEPRGSEGPLSVLSAAAAALARSQDLDGALSAIVGVGAEALDASAAAVFGQDPDRSRLELLLTLGLDDEGIATLDARVQGDADHPIQRAALERRAMLAPRPTHHARVAVDLPLVVTRHGVEECVGVLSFAWPAGEGDRASAIRERGDEPLLGALADLVAVAIEHFRALSLGAERAEWFERLAHSDALTGLANDRTLARLLELEVARAQRQGSEVSVAVFDVDGFADLGAGVGARAADLVLREVAAVLAESVRLVDTVARTGAAEFVLVAPGSAGVTVARRILEGIARLPAVEGHAISVSAGVARFPDDGTDGAALVAAARGSMAGESAGGGRAPGSISEAAAGSKA